MSCCHPAEREHPETGSGTGSEIPPAFRTLALNSWTGWWPTWCCPQAASPRGCLRRRLCAGRKGPERNVSLAGFSLDATTVTNNEFARFVEATGFWTGSEAFGYSAAFHLLATSPEAGILDNA